jgi:pyridoxal phosphate enzyme (YggS family)
MSSIVQRLEATRARIEQAATAAGRSSQSVVLVAVSKRKPIEMIREAYAAGQRDFGENYAQELAHKAEQLGALDGIRWHMIGHLQRNKARQVIDVAWALHTVDSVRLTEELERRAQVVSRVPLRVLVEVNVAGELSKSGCTPADLEAILDAVERQPSLRLSGLMTMPPYTEDPHGAHPYFEELVRLRDTHGGQPRLPELSMGMSHDLEEAISTGATLVRVGTAIFGER